MNMFVQNGEENKYKNYLLYKITTEEKIKQEMINYGIEYLKNKIRHIRKDSEVKKTTRKYGHYDSDYIWRKCTEEEEKIISEIESLTLEKIQVNGLYENKQSGDHYFEKEC